MLTITSCGAVVGIERSVYYRERAAYMYSSLPYSAAQAFVEVKLLPARNICTNCGNIADFTSVMSIVIHEGW